MNDGGAGFGRLMNQEGIRVNDAVDAQMIWQTMTDLQGQEWFDNQVVQLSPTRWRVELIEPEPREWYYYLDIRIDDHNVVTHIKRRSERLEEEGQ